MGGLTMKRFVLEMISIALLIIATGVGIACMAMPIRAILIGLLIVLLTLWTMGFIIASRIKYLFEYYEKNIMMLSYKNFCTYRSIDIKNYVYFHEYIVFMKVVYKNDFIIIFPSLFDYLKALMDYRDSSIDKKTIEFLEDVDATIQERLKHSQKEIEDAQEAMMKSCKSIISSPSQNDGGLKL